MFTNNTFMSSASSYNNPNFNRTTGGNQIIGGLFGSNPDMDTA